MGVSQRVMLQKSATLTSETDGATRLHGKLCSQNAISQIILIFYCYEK
jgi:hypothetical protein